MASRKEQKERLRQERQEREAAVAAAAAQRKRIGYAAAGVLIVGVIVTIVVVIAGGGGGGGSPSASSKDWPSGSVPTRKETDLAVAAKLAGCVLKHPPSQGRTHVLGHVNYKTAPPTSGPHNPVWAHDGAYR